MISQFAQIALRWQMTQIGLIGFKWMLQLAGAEPSI